jgi:hypothetical protein
MFTSGRWHAKRSQVSNWHEITNDGGELIGIVRMLDDAVLITAAPALLDTMQVTQRSLQQLLVQLAQVMDQAPGNILNGGEQP